jgi:hypothetical protein
MPAVDFFTVETVYLQRLHVLFFIELGEREQSTTSSDKRQSTKYASDCGTRDLQETGKPTPPGCYLSKAQLPTRVTGFLNPTRSAPQVLEVDGVYRYAEPGPEGTIDLAPRHSTLCQRLGDVKLISQL